MTLSAAKSTPAGQPRPSKSSALFRMPAQSASSASSASAKTPKPAKPAKPAKRTDPAKTSATSRTIKPARPAKPEKADRADRADKSATSATSTGTTKTTKTAKPAKPAKPARTTRIAKQAKPDDPATSSTTNTSTDLFAARVPTSGSVMRKAALIVVVSAGLFVLTYLVAVRTSRGQGFEDAVWLGSGQTAADRPVQASNALSRIDDWSGGAALAAVFLIGLLRRRIALALTGVAVVGASIVTAEVLKDRLSRPNMVPGSADYGNSFPSGHTSVAMALMVALILVVPYRIRGLVAFCSAALATGIGALTIIARWHRPSDTLGADLIVLIYAGAAVFLLAAFGHVRPATLRFAGTKAVRSIFVVGPILLGTFLALCGAAVFALLTFFHPGQFAGVSANSRAALLAGCLLALAGSGLATLVLLWLLGRLDLIPPLARRVRPAQDGR